MTFPEAVVSPTSLFNSQFAHTQSFYANNSDTASIAPSDSVSCILSDPSSEDTPVSSQSSEFSVFVNPWSQSNQHLFSSDTATVSSTSTSTCASTSLSTYTAATSVSATSSNGVSRPKNPRRTGTGPQTQTGCPPSLIRQSDRKVNFVDNLVDSSTHIVEAIWPLSAVVCRHRHDFRSILPLRTFIQETLRRSRTSYSTLQVALYYLVLIRSHIPSYDFTMEQGEDQYTARALQCGRRMFLAALILASKYLQDRNYSARAWSKISGLNVFEINQNEMAFLLAVNWKLHILDDVFKRWTDVVLKFSPSSAPLSLDGSNLYLSPQAAEWRKFILGLSPGLDNLDELLPGFLIQRKRLSAANLAKLPGPFPASIPSLVSLPGALPSSPAVGCNSTPSSHTTTLAALEPKPAATSVKLPSLRYSFAGHASTNGGATSAATTCQRQQQQQRQHQHQQHAAAATGLSIPAVARSSSSGKASSMMMALSQASSAQSAQLLDRMPVLNSAARFPPRRRSSLAVSVSSSLSSPESMVSDSSSQASRSSSISSVSSLCSAPSSKLVAQTRVWLAKTQLAKQRFDQVSAALPAIVHSSPTDAILPAKGVFSSSPESYSTSFTTSFSHQADDPSMDTLLCGWPESLGPEDHVAAAARVLTELPVQFPSTTATVAAFASTSAAAAAAVTSTSKSGLKRRRGRGSMDDYSDELLQNRVRDLLWEDGKAALWSSITEGTKPESALSLPQPSLKRRRCALQEVSQAPMLDFTRLPPPSVGLTGPGMWSGVI